MTFVVAVAVAVTTFVEVAGAMIGDDHPRLHPAAVVAVEAWHPISDVQGCSSADLPFLAAVDDLPLLPAQLPELAAVSASAVAVVSFAA
jgi:hypothetical protein